MPTMTDPNKRGVYKRELLECGEGYLVREKAKNGKVVSEEFILDYEEAKIAFSFLSRHMA